MSNVKQSKEFKKLSARLAQSGRGRARTGTRTWIENHEKGELILATIDLFLEHRRNGEGWSYDEFVERVLKPEFGYRYRAPAFRTYIETHHPKPAARPGAE